MSSLRNAVRRRPYKERAQPKVRESFGLLEKHKDYKLRAKDYNSKQKRLKSLKEKAAQRNPEEFYYGMVRSKTKDGVHKGETAIKPMPPRVMRVIKAQDSLYLASKRTSEGHKIERLRASLHDMEPNAGGTHTLFVEDEAEAEAFDMATHFDTAPELAHRRFNRIRTATLATETVKVPKEVRALAEANDGGRALDKWLGGVERQQRAAYTQLEQRVGRKAKIGAQVDHLEQQRALMGNGAKKKRTVTTTTRAGEDGAAGQVQKRAVYKWKTERKR
ncbi:putative u3 small nucleolar rna-associated protein 11 [Pavlovales sp. CCMP2436]|nr:putative u3 small nucleolar rna-associated protein 11 [Pavlovales sp. CCMP2436]